MYPLTPAQQTALVQGARIVRKATICDTAGNVLAPPLDITAGQVVENETTATRWTCTASLAALDLVPGQIGDLLHPLSGNELRMWKGGRMADGSTLWVPMGVYRTSKPKIVGQVTGTGGATTVAVTGADRSSEISRRGWTAPYTPASGATVEQVIADVVTSRWTGDPLQMSLYPSGVIVPAGTVLGMTYTSSGFTAESGSTSGANDPWADMVTLAKSAGCELYFDETGALVMRPVPQAGTVPDATTFLQEGVNCTVSDLERDLDESEFRNVVQVVGLGATIDNGDGSVSPGAPVYAQAFSIDPLLGVGGPLGARPEQITDQTIATVADAQIRANAELALLMSTLDDLSFKGVDLFWLRAGDTVPVARAVMKINAGYVPSILTHPFDLANPMSVTCRSFSIPVAVG